MHDKTTYTYHGDAPITGLTHTELDKLQLGYMVRQEQEADAYADAGTRSSGGSYSDQRKRDHKRSIRQRLRQN